jgi:hypothetical protein
MQPSTTSTTVNNITASTLNEGHTNVTLTFDLTLKNLMETGSTLTIDFDRTLYPLWEMTDNLACTITKPTTFVGTCAHLENGFLITVN